MGKCRTLLGMLLAVVVVVAVVVAAGSASGAAGTPAASPAASPGASPASTSGTPSAQAVTIIIKDFVFVPANVTVKVGTTVTWVNEGPTPHTATAYGKDGQKIWDSNILTKGEKYSVTFKEPGSYDYLCSLHPFMKAHLTVVK